MSFDVRKTEASKRQTRHELAKTEFSEKLRILEELRRQKTVRIPKEEKPPLKPAQEPAKPILMGIIRHTVEGAPLCREVAPGSEIEKSLSKEVEAMFAQRERGVEALMKLFPEGISVSSAFWDCLDGVEKRIGWGDASHRAIGLLLALAIEQLPRPEGEALLRRLPQLQSSFFFSALDSLYVLTSERELRPEFASEWFPALVRRIGNDLASDGFWKALGIYCERYPKNALETLSLLAGAKDDEQISVAAYMLGAVRCVDLGSSPSSEFVKVEAEFSNDSAPGARSVYYRSWIETAWRGKMSQTELGSLAERMWRGSSEEQEQAFAIISRSLQSPSISTECFTLGLDWLHGHASATISSVAKYHVVSFAAWLRPENRQAAADLILSVQPVLAEHKGIWQRIEHFLVKLLDQDLTAFSDFFMKLAHANAQNWLKVMNDPRGLEWLLSELRSKDVGEVVARLVLDENSECRKLGLFFFDKLELRALPHELFKKLGENPS